MAAIVKARRTRDGKQVGLIAVVVPCVKKHPNTTARVIRLIVDTGSQRSHLRRQAVPGVKGKSAGSVYGVTGNGTPATAFRGHLVFLPEDGERQPQVLTGDLLCIEAASKDEDGLLGLDFVRGVDMRPGGEAVVTVATNDADARMMADSFGRLALDLQEVLDTEDCGCDVVIRKGLTAWRIEAARLGRLGVAGRTTRL